MKKIILTILVIVLTACARQDAPTPTANASPAPTAPSTTTIQRVNESTPLFKRANIPGFTDIQEGTNGIAL
ncbi:MAG: hypothetical protein FJ009_12865, partial [Chloroflexi bacterium]|nr:hypothetical protein [Chloroflexota bacterium]